MINNCQSVRSRPYLSLKGTAENQNPIDQPANSKHAAGKNPENTGTDLSDIEAVDAQITEKKRQDKRCPLAFCLKPKAAG